MNGRGAYRAAVEHVAVVAGPDPGHAFPALALARALRQRGLRVTFVSGTSHEPAAMAEGLAFRELPLLAPTSRDHDLGHRLWGRAAEMAPPLADLLRDDPPDLLVADVLTRAGAFAAELLDRRWIELSPHHLMDPAPDVPPVGLGRRPSRTPWRRRDDARIRRLQEESFAAGRRHERGTRGRLGLPAHGGRPLARLLATLPDLEYPREDWPEDAHVVGPLEWDPPWEPLEPPAGDGPLVLVTDSTASTIGFSLGQVALRALRHTGLRLVVTTGRDDLGAWPGAVVGRSPHGPLLDEAAVAVALGGHGFVGKSLVRGVPLVVVPWMGDQRETAGRLRHVGAGIRLSPRRLGPRTLRWSVLRVLNDPRFAERAGEVGRGAEGLGPAYAAELVERIGALG